MSVNSGQEQEIQKLKERASKLAMDKSYLQLIMRLMNRMSEAQGLSNTIENMLKNILDVIGGANIILYYWIDSDLFYWDVYGKQMNIEKIEDPLVQKTFETREPLEEKSDFAKTKMKTPEFGKAYTWVFPLVVGPDIIGVLKMENLHIGMHNLYSQLPSFFNYAALILKNEILGHTRLKTAYDDLEQEVMVRKQAEDELRAANERLLELDRMKSLFIASMSHELRTPLNSIIGFTGMLLNDMSAYTQAETTDYLGRVNRAGEHLLAMITDVIDISKLESGRIDIIPEDFDLKNMVKEAVDEIIMQATDKGLSLIDEVPEKLIMHTDRKRLFQCVLNLLSNALKFTEAGKIHIMAAEKNEHVDISVSDTGIGISNENIPKIFEPFERLEGPLKIKAGGTGLGLYLTKKLVTEVLQGEIDVESEKGKGSTFRLKVPKDIELVRTAIEKKRVK